ncbi:kre5p [Saccharomyces arboricola H-6]|uniref:Kre5p n=1 Tax=Saccharomyces arboricola (strain H-6 / AS 2.3317 / CBS 10644) TaxID=1160507 RepID=J8LHJ2_SACAR|nr:kre5p [Saccharomyces arboricola H-6]
MRLLALVSIILCAPFWALAHSLRYGVPESVQVWSILVHLLGDFDVQLLAELYPLVTGLDEEVEAQENLVALTSNVLRERYAREDVADLLDLYARLYPMGVVHDSARSDTTQEPADGNYFVLNSKRYEKSDDIFYLKSKDLVSQQKLPDFNVIQPYDVVIGSNPEAPILVLYGCPTVDNLDFEEFNRNLFMEAMNEEGKIRFIWRPTCSLDGEDVEQPLNFPLAITLQDDCNVSSIPQLNKILSTVPSGLSVETAHNDRLHELKPEELRELDLKVTSLFSKYYQDNHDTLATLNFMKNIVNNFPLLDKQLAGISSVDNEIIVSNEKLDSKGFDFNMLGLYINGQNWKITSLDSYNLLNALKIEYENLLKIASLLQNLDSSKGILDSKLLLNKFSQFSLGKLQNLQPIKMDLHTIPGFSESIIYFNDIENDPQYNELINNVQTFFDKSKFGELPEIRQNWSEIIFVIDFAHLEDNDVKEALSGLVRAIGVVSQGYPQRVGLLPFNSGSDKSIVNKIYELKNSINGPAELKTFLETMLLADELTANTENSKYESVPDVHSLLSDLQIDETSIIINGEIYPFRKNTWNYLIAKVIKKDTEFLRKELSTSSSKNKQVSVRDLLHYKSANLRHNKYIPNYFADSLYSSVNNTALKSIGQDRIMTYTKDKKYNILHTITLVDDFNSINALERLQNLLGISFVGVRIRVIHVGDVSNSWAQLRDSLSKNDPIISINKFIDGLKTKIGRSNKYSKDSLNQVNLHKWLPDIPLFELETGSFIVLNGRFIHLDQKEVPEVKHFEAILKREAIRTIDSVFSLDLFFHDFSQKRIDPDFIEMISSTLTRLFYQSTHIYGNGIEYTTESSLPRMDLSQFFEPNNLTMFEDGKSAPIDLLLILDPLEERSQLILSLVEQVKSLQFINIQVVLMPTLELNIVPIRRIYVDDTEIVKTITSESNGIYQELDIEMDVPNSFVIDNNYHMKELLIELHAFSNKTALSAGNIDGVGGVCLELVDHAGKVIDRTTTMKTFGYGQFRTDKFLKGCSIRSCDSRYTVQSYSVDGHPSFIPSDYLDILSYTPYRISVKLAEQFSYEEDNEESDSYESSVNIFTVLEAGLREEEKYKQMVLSILSKCSESQQVNFFILDQPFISDSLKKYCEYINVSNEMRGNITFLHYEWPQWLRPQRFSSRRRDVSKFLFLDVIFPQNVSKILYMTPTETPFNPFDLFQFHGLRRAPLGLFRMNGNGYWREAYWEKMLRENNLEFYSTEPGFLINLERFRELNAGDKYRIHYQRVSSDARSLVNIGQDLVNDLQLEVPIRFLKGSYKKKLIIDEKLVAEWSDNINAFISSVDDGKSAEGDHGSEDQDYGDSTFLHDEL